MSNKLLNGFIKNNNPKSPIAYFEIITVKEFRDYEGGVFIDQIRDIETFLDSGESSVGEPFYQIYGKRYSDDVLTTPIYLGEFQTIEDVKKFIYYITGEVSDIITNV